MTGARVAVIGAGDVGAAVVRHLALSNEVGEIVAVDIDETRGRLAVDDAAAIALYSGLTPRLSNLAVDLMDSGALDGALATIKPDAIVQAATLSSWWVITQLPKELWRRLESEARFGPWLPFHLLPTTRVMESVARTVPGVPVVNIAFPDAVNPVLGKLGMAPLVGAGNSDLLRPGLVLAAARHLGVETNAIHLELIAHHYHVVHYWMGLEHEEDLDPSTYHLSVHVEGRDVTSEIDPSSVMAEAGRALPKGRAIGERTAASATKNVRLLLGSTMTDDHATAPLGLAGGYDARFGNGKIELRLPEGVDLTAAAAMTTRAQRGDGIESINPDGSVTFTTRAADAMHEILGYDCSVLKPDELSERVDELRALLKPLTTP